LKARPLSFSPSDRVLVIAPHPDDETLGAGGVILSSREARASVKVLCLTYGDHNKMASLFYRRRLLLSRSDCMAMGRIRRQEALRAASYLGLSEEDLIFLGYPDFGMLKIWRGHWGPAKPFRRALGGMDSVPYEDGFSFGNDFKGDNIVHDIEKVLLMFRPTVIFVSAPFDVHPDHQAAYLYLEAAAGCLLDSASSPRIYLYLIHGGQWPSPRGYLPERFLKPPADDMAGKDPLWVSYPLHSNQVRLKGQALSCYRSQLSYNREFLLSFVRSNELFLSVF